MRAVRLVLLAVLVVGPVVATVHATRSGPQLHDVRVEVLGPAFVAETAADAANGAGTDDVVLVARPTEDRVAANLRRGRALVRDGEADAALVIDLAGSADTLHVAEHRSALARALRARLAVVSTGFGRTLEVEVVRNRAGDPPSWAPRALFAGWLLGGLLLAAAMTAWRGPVPASEQRATARLLGLAALGLVAGVVSAWACAAAWSTPFWAVAAAGTCTVALTAWLTTALENLFGLAGLAATTAIAVAPLAILLLDGEPDSLPAPWHRLRLLLPHDPGYTLTVAATHGLAEVPWRAVAVATAWALIALVTLSAAYRHRPQA